MPSAFRVIAAIRPSGRRWGKGEGVPNTLQPEEFEYLRVGAGVCLVRVSARLDLDDVPVQAQLEIRSVEHADVFAALPEPNSEVSPEGLRRMAYSVPAELLDAGDLSFELDLGPVGRMPLPNPVERVDLSLPVPDYIGPRRSALETCPDRERHERLRLETSLDDALADLSDARAIVEQLERRCHLSERGLADFREKLVHAWGESNDLRQLLDARERAHRKATEDARARRATEHDLRKLLDARELELEASRTEVQSQCARLETELADRATFEHLSNQEVEETRQREARLRVEGAEALQNFVAARAQADQARALVDEATGKAEEAERQAAGTRAELAETQAIASRAEAAAEQRADEVKQRERELEAVREELDTALTAAEEQARGYEQRLAVLAESEHKLREQVAALEARLGQTPGRRGRLRRKRPGPTDEVAGGPAELEANDVSQLLGRIDQLEHALAAAADAQGGADYREQLAALHDALAARRVVEDDLRAMLESEKTQLTSARDEVKVLRRRLAESRQGGEQERTELVSGDGEADWSALDHDLLDRLTKAKALAGSD